MDETLQHSTTDSLPKNCSCFTGCFGSSNKKLCKDMKAAASSSKNNNKTTSLTFLSSLCVNKSSVATNHVETAAVSEKPNRSTKEFTHFPKLNKQISHQKIHKQAAAAMNKAYIPAPAPGHPNIKVFNHKKNNSETDKHYLVEEKSKLHRSIMLVKDANRQNLKKEKIKTRSSSFGTLQVENSIVSPKTTKVLPHSMSLPPLNRTKEKAIRGENDIDNGGETQGKLDSIVGMSIMIGTLAIMLIWGKLCAILCMCAWLYMVPLLRIKENIRLDSSSLDYESVEYKKKIVLEGLLHRDRRRVVGNL